MEDFIETNFTRRGLLSWIANSSFIITLGGFALVILKYLTPNVLFEPAAKFKIGKPEDFGLDSVTFLNDKKIFIVNNDDEYIVISAVCTHLGCTVNLTPEESFHCPCHGSKFTQDGSIAAGPAQKPLKRYEITLSRDGYLIVDMKKEVDNDYYLVTE